MVVVGYFGKKVPLASESLSGYTFERWGGVGGVGFGEGDAAEYFRNSRYKTFKK